jgi:hypothetical protein
VGGGFGRIPIALHGGTFTGIGFGVPHYHGPGSYDIATVPENEVDYTLFTIGMGDPTPRELDSWTLEFYQVVLTTLHDAGIPIAINLPDGGVASNALLGCVLGSLASYCYPSWAGTTQPLVTAHCWIA